MRKSIETREIQQRKRFLLIMPTLHFRRVERRRTARVAVFVDLTVQGLNENNEKFRIQTRSLSVSGYGGLTVLDAVVHVGQVIVLVNENSRQKAECKVASVRPGGDGKNIVAFEFLCPDANFWKISFPPAGSRTLRRSLPASATR
jgi:c-di-GMP-binding flagellar brake protein YcgR